MATLPGPERDNAGSYAGALAVIEQAQAKLKEELDTLREQVEHLQEMRTPAEKEKEREREHGDGGGEQYEARLQAVEKKVEEIAETIRLEWVPPIVDIAALSWTDRVRSQARLYARLLNSTITTNKMALTPPVMANGKTPQNFPATKGEFEHLTSTSLLLHVSS